jgi:hypothetical protein
MRQGAVHGCVDGLWARCGCFGRGPNHLKWQFWVTVRSQHLFTTKAESENYSVLYSLQKNLAEARINRKIQQLMTSSPLGFKDLDYQVSFSLLHVL